MILMTISRSDTASIQVGRFISERRKDLRLTQDELAKRVGISRLSIIHIESGRSNARLSTIVGILNVLKICLEAREQSYERRAPGDDRQAN
jgi:DNA-binding XRE family transcriptional regulator